MKKLIALVLASVMTIAMVACGNANNKDVTSESGKKESTPVVSSETSSVVESTEAEKKNVTFPLAETMEFTVATIVQSDNNSKLSDSPAMKYALERANISFDYIAEVPNAEALEKFNLLMAGDEYPDMFFKRNPGNVDQLGADGKLIPLEDLIREYAPHCAALLDERDGWGAITAADGHVYQMPYFGKPNTYAGQAPLYINTKWLEAVGKDMPTTLDELYEVMVAFKNEDPNGNGEADEIPILYSVDTFLPQRFLNYMPDDMVNIDNYLWYKDDGTIESYAMSENYKENYLEYFKKLYDEGLLYENSFTDQYAVMKAVQATKTEPIFGVLQFSSARMMVTKNDWTLEYDIIPSLGSAFTATNGVSRAECSITDKCENPEVLMAWLDYFYTEEGSRLAWYGVEGVHYEAFEDGTYRILESADNPKWEQDAVDSSVRIGGTTTGPIKSAAVVGINEEYAHDLDAVKAQTHIDAGTNRLPETARYMPVYPLNDEEAAAEIAVYLADFQKYITNFEAQVITGQLELDEDAWNEHIKTLENMNVGRIVEVHTEAYNAYFNSK